MDRPYDEGYPSSSEDDLDPGAAESESLDEADRAAGEEHRVSPAGRRPDDSVEDEDRIEGAGEAE